MKTERWFNVLVVGGAMLSPACGTTEEVRPSRRGTGGGAGTAGSTAETGGAGSSGASDAGPGGSPAGSGGVSSSGGAGDASGGSTTAGGASSGGASSGESGSGGTGGMGDGGGSGGQLQCHLDSKGLGRASDPCGCSCCWAKDCLNTDAVCCVGFCKSADNGQGCCGK